jgi:hypothetical protein|eukprot:COSAG06_NODE_139_length_22328_cov_53.042107_19_plen_216_part_00
MYLLGVFATMSLFTLAPRAAFVGTLPVLDVVQEVGSIGFAVLYMLGVRKIRRERQTRTQHKRLSLLDESSAIESRTWSVSALDHPANVVTQVVLASLVPTAGDVLSFGLGSDSNASQLLVAFPGCLRLLHLLGFVPLFRQLDTNLAVPHYPVFFVKSLTMLFFSVHYAACTFWALARSDEFSDRTWVGAQMPQLSNATVRSENASFARPFYFIPK